MAEESHKVAFTDWRDSLDLTERIRIALDERLDVDWEEPSDVLVEFFEAATIESVKPFLRSDQLLQHAARYANDPAVITFLVEAGFDPDTAFGLGIPAYPHEEGPDLQEGPLHYAAKYNPNPGIVEALVRGGADLHATAGMHLDPPLHYAALHNNPTVVLELIENGAQIDRVNGRISPYFMRSPNINGNTALHRAVFNDDPQVIITLTDAGANAQVRNSSGLTPLHFAVRARYAGSISALVRQGADPNAVITLVEEEDQMHDCTGCNSIHLLVDSVREDEEVEAGNLTDLLKVLVDGGTDINAWVKCPGMYEGYSPLRLAVESELDSSVVALLIEFGAQVEPEALHAVFSESFQYSGKYAGAYDARSVGSENNLKVLDQLLASGVEVNSRDHCGRTPLHRAVSFAYKRNPGVEKAVGMLIRAGADVNSQTYVADSPARESCGSWGFSPLHEVAKWGSKDESGYAIASMLLEAGADRSVRNRSGKTARDVAVSERMKALLNVN